MIETRVDQDTELAVGLPQIQVVAGVTEYIDVRDFLREGEDLGTMADADVIARVNELLELDLGVGYKVTRPSTGNILVSRNATFGIELGELGPVDVETGQSKTGLLGILCDILTRQEGSLKTIGELIVVLDDHECATADKPVLIMNTFEDGLKIARHRAEQIERCITTIRGRFNE